ncbi:MAG: DNA repair protein RecN (Recombination protein N) [Sulfurimonas sp.]|jgi:DNA repair protein RecN (Recombination protein N)|uniref:ATPase n=1 Tax=Sulfurimonas sp. TaxID=2022749 RepID=UPI0039E27B51
MIERFYLKDFLSFKEVELNLNNGLVVFSGPSGSGKSILMNSILSSLGVSSCEASLCESSVTWQLDGEDTGIENDDVNVFKHIRKEKSRYFINNHTVSKKSMSKLGSKYIRHLSLKDFSDFENENLLSMLDDRVESKIGKIQSVKTKYKDAFVEYRSVRKELEQIEEEERRIVELKEFAAFEIKKIEDINPTLSEDEELVKIKKELSKKEKVLENIEAANAIFEHEYKVSSALESLDVDASFFDDAINELRATLDTAQDRFSALDDVDIEEVLNRIEALSGLKRRYGSIEEAIEYKEKKKLELQKYENIEITKDGLTLKVKNLSELVEKLADKISALRSKELKSFEADLNVYLKELYLRDAEIELKVVELDAFGKDFMKIKLNQTELQKVSTGEFNRLRLAILAMKSEYMDQNGGVLMLDEIDANLSGEESMSVAKVLRQLSKHFQIYVISHQPQLTSMGDQHFLVYKDGEESKVKELDTNGKIQEIARIISGENVSNEAKEFAKELLEVNKCA